MADRAPSSSITYKWPYDVFLSFYGDDTRLGFISHLYESLRQRGLGVFIDYKIRNGENITPALFKAIEESRIAIIVFSKNYANSTFCLQELEKIVECFKEESRLIYPVFYHVDPSELRRPRGSYAQALARLVERFKDDQDQDKVKRWKEALPQAADRKGCHLKPKISNEQECITKITNEVASKINRQPLYVTNYPVGLVSRVKEVISYLDLWSTEKTKMIGIWGAGGIGKSTIARAVYNSVADNFEALCFLSDVRKQSEKENGLSHLQETLLCRLAMEKDLKLDSYYEGIPIIEYRLSQKKILLILDDVDRADQLGALAGSCNWFGCGSRIIITTRNKQLLVSHDVKSIYDVKELNDKESLKLLSWYAFKNENVDSDYMEVCIRAVDYSCGFPLALKVIGSNLCRKGVDRWRSKLLQLRSTLDKDILGVLKWSYDTLGEVEQQVFLDLACFFNGEKLARVSDILLCIRGNGSKFAIDNLIDRSFIKIEQGRVTMHDLIEDVGKVIVRQESPKEPGEQSRLWFYEDILHVLEQDAGTSKVEAIILDLPENVEIQWSGEEFMNMKSLKMLVIRNAYFSECPKYLPNSLRWVEWQGYPFKYLPYMHQTKLFYLDLSYSSCELLPPLDKKAPNLSCMNLKNCKFVQQIPDLSGASNLKELWLDGCTNLMEIHDSVGCLNQLRELSAMRCKKLKILPSCLRSRSLKHLNLFGCLSLQRFPDISVIMKEMQTLDLDKTAMTELPSSICNLVGLETLNVEECPNLKQLPASICALPNLWKLMANSCKGMSYFKKCEVGHGASLDFSTMSLKMTHLYFSNCNLSNQSVAFCLSHFTSLVHLDLRFNKFTTLPECIKECHNLEYLLLDYCNQLQHIGGLPPNLEKFSALCCTSLTEPSESQVLEQAFNFQPGKRNFIFPGKKFPDSLHFFCRGSSVSFWVRNVFPTIFLWILIKLDHDYYVRNCPLSVYINDTVLDISSGWRYSPTIMTNHIYILDMQSLISSNTAIFLGNKWNEVQVSLRTSKELLEKEAYDLGVHLYDRESSLRNIQFVDPRRCVIDQKYMLQKIQEQEDLQEEEVEEGMNLDSNSRKIADSIENPMSYQGEQPDWDVESLVVKDYVGTTFPTWLGSRSYRNLNELRLINCQNCERIPTLGQLPALRSLTIEGLQSVVTIGSEIFKENYWASVTPFPSLECLYFQHMISWEEWRPIDKKAFPKLSDLGIYDCPKLIGGLPHQLVSLKNLIIENCPLLASSIPECPYIQELLIIKSQHVMLQDQALPLSLRRLAISGEQMLEVLSRKKLKCNFGYLSVRDCSDAVPHPVIDMPPSVYKLCLTDCKSVKFVFVSKVPTLVHLQRICIHDCKFLRSLFDLDMGSLLPNLRELRIEGCPEMEPFSEGSLLPSSLKQLEIINCDKLLSCHTQWQHIPSITTLIITTPSVTWHCTGLQHLTSLQRLEILHSPKLEKIEGGMMPPSLQSLRILGCCLLEERCRNKDEEIWHKISDVPYISLNGKTLIERHLGTVSHHFSQMEARIVHVTSDSRSWVQPDWDTGSLVVQVYMGTTFPTWLGRRSYRNLSELRLINCQKCERIPTLGQLPALRSLTIEGLQSVVTIGSEFFKENYWASVTAFPSLENLHFKHMISWEEWRPIDKKAFPKLSDLGIYDCPKLIGGLPHQLVSLKNLIIENCPLLASSIPECPYIQELLIIKSQHVMLQDQALPLSLRRLAISGEQMLEVLSRKKLKCNFGYLSVRDCSDAVPHPVIDMPPSVYKLCLTDCKSVKFVFVSKVPTLHLQRISICDCKFLRSLFDRDMGSLLPNLRELCIDGCPEMEPFSEGSLLPSSLKQLEIINCDKLLSCHTQWQHIPSITTLIISTPSESWHCIGLQHLTSLQFLQILGSPKLEKIEGGMMPPSLLFLIIVGCRLLEERCRNKDEEIWHKISDVRCISLNGKALTDVHSNIYNPL